MEKKENRIRKHLIFIVPILLVMCACTADDSYVSEKADADETPFPVPAIDYQPRNYVCMTTVGEPTIDGKLSESSWQAAPWTELFIDIQGKSQPSPQFATRAKMLWDSNYFYIGAQMEEPHLWGTLTDRDAVIYHDNDFELFIDPDGDSHEYYELEINVLGTEWDLLLIRPYRDGAPAVNAWDIQGLETAVFLDGTLNNPSDKDSGWSVEIAIPWKVLAECAHRPAPPNDGDSWWVNFSRVQWQLDVINGRYVKRTDSTGQKSLPEDNWVWSPQGLIAMHYPEMWGLVQFSTGPVGENEVAFAPPDDLQARWALRQLYYAEREHEAAHGRFSPNLIDLSIPITVVEGYNWPPSLHATDRSFTATLTSDDSLKLLSIDTYGRLKSSDNSLEEK